MRAKGQCSIALSRRDSRIKKRRLELPRLGYRRRTLSAGFCSPGTRWTSGQIMHFQRNEGEAFLREAV
jgi:hypothetical protein